MNGANREPTVRERVKEIQRAMLAGNPTPDQMRSFRAELSGMLGIANDARTAREILFKRRLAEIRKTVKSVADARLGAEATTPEYQEWQEAINVCESAMEMMRTCRDNLKSLDSEMDLAR